MGKNDIEEALKRLDRLTQDEARMAAAQLLKVANMIDSNVGEIADNVVVIDDKVAGVDERVAGVDEHLAGIDDRGKDVNDRVRLLMTSKWPSLMVHNISSISHRNLSNFYCAWMEKRLPIDAHQRLSGYLRAHRYRHLSIASMGYFCPHTYKGRKPTGMGSTLLHTHQQ
jgi:hypothetical protein